MHQVILLPLKVFCYRESRGIAYVVIYNIVTKQYIFKSFPCGSAGKEFACNVGDLGLIPGLPHFQNY